MEESLIESIEEGDDEYPNNYIEDFDGFGEYILTWTFKSPCVNLFSQLGFPYHQIKFTHCPYTCIHYLIYTLHFLRFQLLSNKFFYPLLFNFEWSCHVILI